MSDNLDKVKLRRENIEGVQKSFNNLEQLSTVKMLWTKVKTSIYKKKGITFIGTKDPLDVGDVIQTGNYSIKYKVVSERRLSDRGGYIYRIKRADGYNTTSQDIDGSKVGQKVRITNRRTFQQIFNDTPHGTTTSPEVVEEPPVCDETPECVAKSSEEDGGNPEVHQYRMTISAGAFAGSEVTYIDEDGAESSRTIPLSKVDTVYVFCAGYLSIKVGGQPIVSEEESCVPGGCLESPDILLERIGLCI